MQVTRQHQNPRGWLWFGILVVVGAVAFTLGKEYGRRVYSAHPIDCSYLEVRSSDGAGRRGFTDATYELSGSQAVVAHHDGGGRSELTYEDVVEIICRP